MSGKKSTKRFIKSEKVINFDCPKSHHVFKIGPKSGVLEDKYPAHVGEAWIKRGAVYCDEDGNPVEKAKA